MLPAVAVTCALYSHHSAGRWTPQPRQLRLLSLWCANPATNLLMLRLLFLLLSDSSRVCSSSSSSSSSSTLHAAAPPRTPLHHADGPPRPRSPPPQTHAAASLCDPCPLHLRLLTLLLFVLVLHFILCCCRRPHTPVRLPYTSQASDVGTPVRHISGTGSRHSSQTPRFKTAALGGVIFFRDCDHLLRARHRKLPK